MRRHVLSIAFVVGCSTVADPPPEFAECTADEDCAEGLVCAEGPQVCLPASELPPRVWLGLDIQEVLPGQPQPQFRVEIAGCDVVPEAGKLILHREELSQTLELAVFRREAQTDDPLVLDALLPARFELRQASRLARAPAPLRTLQYPTTVEDGLTAVATRVPWARYHPVDYDPGFILWQIAPSEGQALRYHMLVPPPGHTDTPCASNQLCEEKHPGSYCDAALGYCRPKEDPTLTAKFAYDDVGQDSTCDGRLVGRVVAVDTGATPPPGLGGASITVRHAEADAEDPDDVKLGLRAFAETDPDPEPQCSTDADCIGGEQFCDLETNQCLLDLAGRLASPQTQTDENGGFSAPVYTYCEGFDARAFERGFTVAVQPPTGEAATAVYPSVNYKLTVEFPAPNQGGPDAHPAGSYEGDLCVPSWGPPVKQPVVFSGTPSALASTEQGDYVCCDVSCLPATPDAAEMTPPTAASACNGRTATGATPSIRLETPFEAAQADWLAWEAAGCAQPHAADDGTVGQLRIETIACPNDPAQPCTIDGIAGGTTQADRRYELRVEMPPGSVLGSAKVSVDMPAAGQPLEPLQIELPPRVLVRGRVTLPGDLCDPATAEDGDCGSEGATILAERLRIEGEDPTNVLGPYFHQVETFYAPSAEAGTKKGNYVLPLDRGVWIITALPSSGTQGGPARFEVRDLREPDVVGVPDDLDFVLVQGRFVTVELDDDFDLRATIAPIDRGTWLDEGLVDPLGTPLDLNAIDQCWIARNEEPQGCKIRRLLPATSRLVSQVGTARFFARLAQGVPPNVGNACVQ